MQVRKLSFISILGSLLSATILSLWSAASWAAEDAATTEEITNIVPPRVYQESLILAAEVEQIRQHLGRRAPRERSFKLADALPRQTYYQGQTLFRKANQLAQEVAGASRERPAPAPDRELVPGDVLTILQSTRAQLAYVKSELGITEEITPPKLERRRTPSDVMLVIIEASYTLNELIEKSADWPDIYDRVLQMISYVGGALPAEGRYPALPDHVCCKMPQDVYQNLSASMVALGPLAKSTAFALVRVIPKKSAEGGASVDTVYDLTTTMVSDIGEITLRLAAEEQVSPPTYQRPKRILPADVYQLASVLEDQIKRVPPKK